MDRQRRALVPIPIRNRKLFRRARFRQILRLRAAPEETALNRSGVTPRLFGRDGHILFFRDPLVDQLAGRDGGRILNGVDHILCGA